MNFKTKTSLVIFWLLFIQTHYASAAQPMKCVDGSGIVVYTEGDSCAEALRAARPPKSAQELSREKAKANYEEEMRKLKYESMLRKQQSADHFHKKKMEQEWQEKVRAQELADRKEQECQLKKIEADRQRADASAHPYDSWWRNRSVATDREYQVECGG